jgi:thymidine phosphorylase
MVSGRGLGHTGGTLDKLEAIPGYRVDQSPDALRSVLAAVGCAIVGATGRIAPADRRLYAIRDVTATVESIDLITASILSKKLAAGLGALVLDVKVGSGAFLPQAEAARALARSLVDTANGAGCPTVALVTDMDRPLARAAGNALEVAEVMETLTGTNPHPRLVELTVALGGELVVLAGVAGDAAAGGARIRAALDSGAAAERFARMVAALGGPGDFCASWRRDLAPAPVVRPVQPLAPGPVAAIDTRAVGMAVVGLGGGRQRDGDAIDPRVGFSGLIAPGEVAGPDRPLGIVHAADDAAAEAAAAALRAACRIGDPPPPAHLVQDRVA